jgi:hypothetical protein
MKESCPMYGELSVFRAAATPPTTVHKLRTGNGLSKLADDNCSVIFFSLHLLMLVKNYEIL